MAGPARAVGLALLSQAAPAPLAPPAVSEWPKPGLSAEIDPGGRLEEEEEDGSAPAGMMMEAVERPPEEAVEAELWRQGPTSELMMLERWDCSGF